MRINLDPTKRDFPLCTSYYYRDKDGKFYSQHPPHEKISYKKARGCDAGPPPDRRNYAIGKILQADPDYDSDIIAVLKRHEKKIKAICEDVLLMGEKPFAHNDGGLYPEPAFSLVAYPPIY